jgi:hypothetical protein
MEFIPQQLVNAGLFVLMGLVLNWLIRDKFREQAKLIDARFEAVDQRFGGTERSISVRFDAVDQRFEAVEKRSDAMERTVSARFDAVDQRFDSLERRFDRLEDRFEGLASENRAIRADLTQIALAVGARTRPQTG